ncbi:rhodanese-like domain-containing protein [Marinilactibacillus sp. XAAS-LB27]|uniref:rhodanese-like domain-containing protein n=1 Tax=Marinilactibacillus sp. XAAS-LB27 TaxID=3114538 RepID=UPI002E18FE39|nr:rhodanese-like domain-containing protein [Marinilactibacillus sp. XAAS-LB27]
MYRSIGADEFYQEVRNNTRTILDVREIDEFENGHILNARNLPISQLGNEMTGLDKASTYYVICHSGGRSTMASEQLAEQGYDVINVMGGMSSWKGETTKDESK